MAEPLDLNAPLPDRAHESLRQAMVKAIEDIEWNTADAGLGLDLADTLFQLLATVQADVAALQEWRDTLAADVPVDVPADPADVPADAGDVPAVVETTPDL